MKKIFLQWTDRILHSKRWMLLLALFLLLPQDFVFAATGDSDEILQNLTSIISMIMRVLQAILLPALLLIGDLMDADLILGGGMEERMLSLWSLVRNLVNIVFAVFLMGVAVYNVLGLGEDEGNFAIKTALPRLIIGLILVNFTFPIGKIVIDIANVATQVSFSLVSVNEEKKLADGEPLAMATTQNKFQMNVCNRVSESATAPTAAPAAAPAADDAEAAAPATDAAAVEAAPAAQVMIPLTAEQYKGDTLAKNFCALDDKGAPTGELKDWVKADYLSAVNSNNIGLVLAVNMQNIPGLSMLDDEKVKTWSDLSSSIIFSVVIYIVLAFSYIALAWVLLTRIFVLWGALILSPLAVLFYVIPEIKEWLGLGDEMTTKVIKHLFAPVVIGLTLSLGFILMDTWQNVSLPSNSGLENISMESILTTGVANYTDFLILAGSVVVLWMGVFSASSGTFAESVTSQLKEFGETAGSWVAKQPLNLPVIPYTTEGGDDAAKNLSLYSVMSGAKQSMYNFDRDQEANAPVFYGGGKKGNYAVNLKKDVVSQLNTIKTGQGDKLTQETYRALLDKMIKAVEASESLNLDEKRNLTEAIRATSTATNMQGLHTLVTDGPAFKKFIEESPSEGEAMKAGVIAIKNKLIDPAPPRP